MNRDEKAREELHQKKHKEAMEQMKNAKCAWPGCKKKQFMQMSLPVMVQTPQGLVPAGPDGKPADPKDGNHIAMPVPFCDYHFGIPGAGLCAVMQAPDKPGQYQLYAPVDMVQVAEAVVSGMIFSGQLEELMKGRKEQQEKMAKMMEEKKHEAKTKDAEDQGDKPADKPGNK